MKVLFYPIYVPSPHFETELELIKKHIENKDKVMVLVCKGNLKTCFYNPHHLRSKCIECHSKVMNGLKLVKNENLRILKYPKIKIDYSRLPDKFDNIDSLKSFSIDNVTIGLAAASSLISRLNREHKLDTLKHGKDVNVEIKNSYYLAKVFESLIKFLKPDFVYIFNGRIATTAPVVDVCKNTNTEFITHERGGQIDRYWLIKCGIPHDLEKVYKEIEDIWSNTNSVKREELGAKFFLDRRNRIEQGWYSFVKNQNLNSLPVSFNKNRKNVIFYNSTIEEFAAVKGWEKPLFLFNNEIEAIEDIVNQFKTDPSVYFYLRVHPNLKGFDNSQTRDIKELSSKYSNFEVILPESIIDSYSLLDNSDLVITFGSTIGIEAVFFGKPSVQLGLAFYNQTSSVYIPKTKNQIYEYVKNIPPVLNREGALKYGLWELNRGFKFEYFNPLDLTSGTFLGKLIKPSLFVRIVLKLYSLLIYCLKK
jgi:hypothetical protein